MVRALFEKTQTVALAVQENFEVLAFQSHPAFLQPAHNLHYQQSNKNYSKEDRPNEHRSKLGCLEHVLVLLAITGKNF